MCFTNKHYTTKMCPKSCRNISCTVTDHQINNSIAVNCHIHISLTSKSHWAGVCQTSLIVSSEGLLDLSLFHCPFPLFIYLFNLSAFYPKCPSMSLIVFHPIYLSAYCCQLVPHSLCPLVHITLMMTYLQHRIRCTKLKREQPFSP